MTAVAQLVVINSYRQRFQEQEAAVDPPVESKIKMSLMSIQNRQVTTKHDQTERQEKLKGSAITRNTELQVSLGKIAMCGSRLPIGRNQLDVLSKKFAEMTNTLPSKLSAYQQEHKPFTTSK